MSNSVNKDSLTKTPLSKLIVCSECDLLMTSTHLAQDQRIDCSRCGAELQVYRYNMIQRALALTLTALILFIPANFLSILFLNLLGQKREASVWDSVKGLYESGMHAISFIVLLCGFAIPLCKLFCQLYGHARNLFIWHPCFYCKAPRHGRIALRYGVGLLYDVNFRTSLVRACYESFTNLVLIR